MSTDDPAPEPEPAPPARARLGNPFGLTALIVGVVALVLAPLPFASFAAGLPALVAIVFGIVGLVVRDRPRGTAIAGLIVGVVALVTAVVVSAIALTGLIGSAVKNLQPVSDFPSDLVPTEDTGGGAALAPGPHTVTYRITGDGTASIVYSTLANRHSAFARDLRVPLPRTRQQHVTIEQGGGRTAFFVVAVEAGAGRPVSCSIAVDGRTVAQRTSSGPNGLRTVACSYRTAG